MINVAIMSSVFTGLSTLSASIDLAKFIESKLRSDYNRFTHQLKIEITTICDQMRKALNDSQELKYTLPSDINNEIFGIVLSCLKKGTSISPNTLFLNHEDIPYSVRIALSKGLYYGLNESFEFCVRNYAAWIAQDVHSTNEHIKNIEEFLEELLKKPNSAKQYNRKQSVINRFHYLSNTVDFLGRDKEIGCLLEFCGLGGNQPNKSAFSWWVVTGAGGTGKSRLCHEFSKLVTELGWQVCFPANHDFEKLTECSKSLLFDTLFILDYAENNITSIGKWMETLSEERYSNVTIRVLLIQRHGKSLDDIRGILGSETKTALGIDSYVHNDGNFLCLVSPKNAIRQIQESYARYRGISLTPEDSNNLFSLLTKVDPKLLRPLYAIIIVDAFADDKTKPLNWNRKDALEYICIKESRLLGESIKSLFSHYQDYQQMVDIGILLKVFSTMLSGLDIARELAIVLPQEKVFLSSLTPMQLQLFYSVEELFPEDGDEYFCPPLEPDIIGEYFVIRYFRENKFMRDYISNAWKLPHRMKLFVARLRQDHPTNFKFFQRYFCSITITTPAVEKYGFEVSSIITDIVFSETVKSIESCAFRGCTALSSIEILGNLSIGNSAFANCHSLSTIKIKGRILEIGDNAFSQCESIVEIKIRNSIRSIGEAAFSGCSNLECIHINGSINKIHSNAFLGCKKLKDIYIEGSINYIDKYSFKGCRNVTIHVKGKLERSHPDAFAGCRHYCLTY